MKVNLQLTLMED